MSTIFGENTSKYFEAYEVCHL